MEVSHQLNVSAAVSPGKENQYMRLGWPQPLKVNCASTGIRTPVIKTLKGKNLKFALE